MSLSRVSIILSVIFLFNFELISQTNFSDGYVVKSNQERLAGQIKFLLNKTRYKTVRFKSNGKTLQFGPNEISEYGTSNGFLFTSSIIKGEFVEVLVTGALSLYKSKNGFLYTNSNQEIYSLFEQSKVNNLDNGVLESLEFKWKPLLLESMSGCEAINAGIIKGLKLKERDLVKLFDDYNTCLNGNSQVQKTGVSWSKTRIGVNIGSTSTTVKSDQRSGIFIPVYLERSSTTSNISGGLIFNFVSKRRIQNISYNIELNLYSASSTSEITSLIEGPSGSRISATAFTDYKINSISIPLLAKYSIDSWAGAFNLQGGVIFNTNNVDLNVFSSRGAVPQPNIRKLQLGFVVRTGFSKAIGNGEIGVQLGYQINPTLATSEGSFRNINRLTFSVYSLFL